MSSLGRSVYRRVQCIRWDGTNGADIGAMLDQMADDAWWSYTGQSNGFASFRRELNGAVTVQSCSVNFPNVVMEMGATQFSAVSDAHFAYRYRELAETATDLYGASVPPSTPTPYSFYSAVSQVNLPALLLNGTTTLNFTWNKTMPAGITPAMVNWRAHAGTQVLAAIQLQAIANPITVTTTGGTIALQAVGLASIGGIVQLEAQMLTSP